MLDLSCAVMCPYVTLMSTVPGVEHALCRHQHDQQLPARQFEWEPDQLNRIFRTAAFCTTVYTNK
jgi:hypothetical protein